MSHASVIVPSLDEPLVKGNHTYASVTDTVCKITERTQTPRAWYIAFAVAVSLAAMLFCLIG